MLVALLFACRPPDGAPTADALEPPALRISTGVATVAIAEWEPVPGAERSWVEFGLDTTYGEEAPERSPGEAVLLGTPQATELHARLGALVDGTPVYSTDVTITTGALPGGLVPLEAGATSEEPFGDWILTTFTDLRSGSGSDGATMVEIFDRDGEVVWATPIVRGMYFAARPSRDGAALLTLWDEDVITTDNAEICRMDWDGEQSSCLATPGATHDFVELPDGSYTYGKDEPGTWKDYTLLGNTLTNMTLDGVETEIWNAWDEITPVELQDWATHEGSTPIDWTHFNGLWYDEPSESYYASFWMLSEVRKIPGATGRTEWVMGGTDSEFLFDGSEFGPQHAPQLVDGGLLLFDNRFAADASRLIRYSVDEAGRNAVQGTTIVHPEDVHTNAMGDAHLLPNGYYAASFGDAGDMYVFTPDGQTAWSMQPPPGVATGQIYVYDDLYDLRPN